MKNILALLFLMSATVVLSLPAEKTAAAAAPAASVNVAANDGSKVCVRPQSICCEEY
jgi:hypothetical protein